MPVKLPVSSSSGGATRIYFSELTAYDSSTSARDSGNEDLGAGVFALGTGASDAQGARDCVMHLAAVGVPVGCVAVVVRIPTVIMSPVTASDGARVVLLDGTDDATADGVSYDQQVVSSAIRGGVIGAFSNINPLAPGITVERWVGQSDLYYDGPAGRWRLRNNIMIPYDADDESGSPRYNSATYALDSGIANPGTLYLGVALHKPGALATTFTFSEACLEVEFVVVS